MNETEFARGDDEGGGDVLIYRRRSADEGI
jgi:hypothetical protein